MAPSLIHNAQDLEQELDWFAAVLDARLKHYFGTGDASDSSRDLSGASAIAAISPPVLGDSNYARFITQYDLSADERLVLLLALIPHIRPQLLDVLWSKNEVIGRGFTEFGGLHSSHHGGFIPTGETAAFILAGDNLTTRFKLSDLFSDTHLFSRTNVVSLSSVSSGEPLLSGALTISLEYLSRFTTGLEHKPNFSSEFPARLINTQLNWQDLILPFPTPVIAVRHAGSSV